MVFLRIYTEPHLATLFFQCVLLPLLCSVVIVQLLFSASWLLSCSSGIRANSFWRVSQYSSTLVFTNFHFCFFFWWLYLVFEIHLQLAPGNTLITSLYISLPFNILLRHVDAKWSQCFTTWLSCQVFFLVWTIMNKNQSVFLAVNSTSIVHRLAGIPLKVLPLHVGCLII